MGDWKAWEEDWWTRYETSCRHSLRLAADDDSYRGPILAWFEDDEVVDDQRHQVARVELASAAPAMARLLLRIADMDPYDSNGFVPLVAEAAGVLRLAGVLRHSEEP